MTTNRHVEKEFPANLTNYFLHGIVLFFISCIVFLSQVSSVIWLFSQAIIFNVTFSLVLLIIVGTINMITTEMLWSLKIRSNFENWIIQGFLVVLPTQILMFPFYFVMIQISFYPPSVILVLSLSLFFIYTLLFGYIGISVARMYCEEDSTHSSGIKREQLSFNGTRGRCTFCGESYRYPFSEISEERTVRCLNCRHLFYLEPDEELLKKLGEFREKSARIGL